MPASRGAEPHPGTPRLHVVRCGDLDDAARRHPAAAHLLTRDTFDNFPKFPGSTDEFPLIYYLTLDDVVVSHFRIIPDELSRAGRTYPWAWSADNFTVPEHRGRGLSTQLQQQATQDLHAQGIGRGSVLSTDVTLHTFRKLGFAQPGFATRFLMLRSVDPLLAVHVPNRTARAIVSAAATPAMFLAAAALRGWNAAASSGLVCVRVASFADAEMRPLLDRLSHRRTHFSISADALDRKLAIAARTGEMTVWLLQRRDTAAPVGYMVLRTRFQEKPLADRYRNFRLMTLMDFACADDDRRGATAIVEHTIRKFMESDCAVLEVISSHPLVNHAARKRGLLPVGRGMSFSYSVPEAWGWPAAPIPVSEWPLTHFCGDGFSV